MAHITLVCGSERSGRSAHIDALWREHDGTAILLTPTTHLARARQSNLVREKGVPGLLGHCAWELTAFARDIVGAFGRRTQMLSKIERLLMIRRALAALPPHAISFDITPGLVAHLLQVINDLKQAAVEPDKFRRAIEQRAHPGPFDALVATVYERYQEALICEDRYDVPGLYWEAERCCRDSAGALPTQADTILLDGFDDFTLSQERFLAALANRIKRLVIGLHYDSAPSQSDLFHLQERWVKEFRTGADIEIRDFPTDPPENYIHHIGQHLFWRDPPPSPTALQPNAHIMPCADVQHEMETIGRRVKQLITRRDVAPQQIAVCLADIRQTAGPLQTIFESFGIPVSMRIAPVLSSTAVGAFVMRLFEAMQRWERTTVTAALSTPLFYTPPEDASLVMTFPLLSRRSGIVMGRDAWERYFEDNAGLSENDAEANTTTDDRMRALQLKCARFRALTRLADSLGDAAPFHRFAALLDSGLDGFGLEEAAAALGDPEEAAREAAAVRALRSLLDHLATTAWSDAVVSRAEFVRFLDEAMSETRLSLQNTKGPGVCCCSLDGLRHTHFDYVFLGGLNEGTFPQHAPVNAVYSESERAQLRHIQLDLPGRYEHTYRQRLLFCHAVNAAQQELTLSWRKQDGSGRDALPSPFVVDITDLFKTHDCNIALPDPGPDSFLAAPTEAASARDIANSAWYGNHRELHNVIPDITPSIARIEAVEQQRNSAEPFSIYDGCIKAPDLLAQINRLYGESAQFSVNQIESYLRFPFQFFMDRILGIRETRAPETELDPRTRGNLAHEALYRFHKRFPGRAVKDLLLQQETETREAMRACVHAAFHANRHAMRATPEALLRIEQQRLEQALDRYLSRADTDFGAELTPTCFEATFGRAPRDAEEDMYVQEPFPLTIGEETFRLTGRIDRIDLADGMARIVDYKSSTTPSSANIKNGLDLQLTVYAWAVEQHLFTDVSCVEAVYYAVYKNKKCDALLSKKPEESALREENARARIAAAIHGIRVGQFPPVPDSSLDTGRTPAHTAARYEQWRIERKGGAVRSPQEEGPASS